MSHPTNAGQPDEFRAEFHARDGETVAVSWVENGETIEENATVQIGPGGRIEFATRKVLATPQARIEEEPDGRFLVYLHDENGIPFVGYEARVPADQAAPTAARLALQLAEDQDG